MQVPVIVRELLDEMPKLHQRVFQPIEPLQIVSSQKIENRPEVNIIVYKTNTIQERNSVIDQVIRGEALYAISMLRMAMYLRYDPNLYIAMLDNRAEINMMHSLIATKLGLVVI